MNLRMPAALMALSAALAAGPRAPAGDARTGEQIYRARCASCHGAAGEGSEEYKRPLSGDRSPAQLSRVIARTMPEDEPGTCVGEEAEKVAAYIHDAFYSKAAQARNAPPRVELSRLTVRQYRNALADLIGTFRGPATWNAERGLRGEYFKARRFRKDDRVLSRVDPEVRFDFGDSGPEPETFDPRDFSIHWEGSVLAPDTGEYEFVVRTDHGTRLWVNDLNPNRPLIDAWVKSGKDTEFRGSIFLLGGRPYPIKLDFTKSTQGVDDSKKKDRPPPARASIELAWKLPNRVEEVIPARDLNPERSPELFASATPFPPDDRSVGYERGASVSKAWDQATTDGAIEVANYVAARARELAGAKDDDPDRAAKLGAFCRAFAGRAFRRPLAEDQARLYVDRQFAEAADPTLALKRSILLILKSPRFLYRELGGDPADPYDVASRVSFGLWDSPPDGPLLDAASAGRLATREQVAAQAERMMPDLRTRAKLREFFLVWLRADQVHDLAKDPALFPGFDPAVASDLRTSLELTVEDGVWGEASDFRQLLLADSLFLNGRLAKFYGSALPADAPFTKVGLEPAERAGVLTHPYLLASFAYTATSSPIHRGVFLSRSVLGRALRPPPEAVAPLAPDLHAGLSTRDRVALQTSPPACMTCHGMINPLGFALERFDAVGRFRSEEKGRPVDAAGSYETRGGESLPFAGARELAAVLADSEEAHSAFVEQLFHHMVKQPIRAYGPGLSADLRKAFAAQGFHIRKLAAAVVAASALPPADRKP